MSGYPSTPEQGCRGASASGVGFIFGGHTGAFTDLVERYDPDTDSWVYVTSMPYTANGISAENVGDPDTIIIAQGNGGGGGRCAKYSVSTDTWTSLDNTTAVSEAGCTEYNGKFWTFGGVDSNVNPRNFVQIYDPETDTWDSSSVILQEPTRFNVAAGVMEDS